MKTRILHYGVALTGCIGSGKSSVSQILQKTNHSVLCADSIAHIILQESANEVAETFGADIVQNSIVDRKALGAIVFSDKNARKILESLLHPKIRAYMLEQAYIFEDSKKPYFLDIPLFFESGGKQSYPVPYVALVYADRQTCLERVIIRDKLNVDSANARIEAQIDIEQKRAMSDFVIENMGSFEMLSRAVEDFLNDIYQILGAKR